MACSMEYWAVTLVSCMVMPPMVLPYATASRASRSFPSATARGRYIDTTGHKLGDWITDKEPTTVSEGSRHKECESCGKTLETEATPKLYLTATTDTHGEAVVGGYLVIVTDTDTKNPVSGAGIALDKAGSISIRLPNSCLLDYADQTTVTVLLSKDNNGHHLGTKLFGIVHMALFTEFTIA